MLIENNVIPFLWGLQTTLETEARESMECISCGTHKLITQVMKSTTEGGVSVSRPIALRDDGIDRRCPQQRGGVLSERVPFQRLWTLDVTRDKMASDKSEGEMEQAEANGEMALEEETSRCVVAVQ